MSILEYAEPVPEKNPLTDAQEELRHTFEVKRDVLSLVVEGRAVIKNTGLLMRNFPEFFESQPAITSILQPALTALGDGLTWIESRLQVLTPQDIKLFEDSYNYYAGQVNTALQELFRDSSVSSTQDQIQDFSQKISAQTQEEIKDFTASLFDEMFPPTYSRQFYEYLQGKGIDAPRLLTSFAVADGLESTLRGFVSLLDPQTYIDMKNSVATMMQMDAHDWMNAGSFLKTEFSKMSSERAVFICISLITGFISVNGGLSKLKTASKIPADLALLIAQPTFRKALFLESLSKVNSVTNLARKAEAVPALAIIGGGVLRICDLSRKLVPHG